MKKRFMILFMLVIAMVATVFGVAACGGGTSSNGITLSETEVSLEVGETKTITATYSGSDTLTWASGDTSIATVTQLANAVLVKGVAEGSTTLTATAGEYSATCNVTVTAAVTYTILLDGTAVTTADVVRTQSITLTATASDGSEISYWYSADTSIATVENGVVTGVAYGTTTISAGKDSSHYSSITLNVVAAEGTVGYTLEEKTEAEALEADSDTWYYWTEWAIMAENLYEDGTITLTFTNNAGNWYNLQVFYKNTTLTEGSHYKLTFKINTTVTGSITVNGTVVELAAGDNNVSVTYTESSSSSGSIQFGVEGVGTSIVDATVVLSDFVWTEIQAETLVAPSFTVSDSGVITITDNNNDAEKVSGYKFYLYNSTTGVLAGAIDVTNGMNVSELNTSAINIGTYTAYLRAIGSSSVYSNSENSTESITIEVTEEPAYTLTYSTEANAVATPGVWYYWSESWVSISNNYYADNTVTISFSNNAGNWYDTQLFYKSTELTAGTIYTLTFTLTLDEGSAGGNVTINGTVFTLTGGENNISVSYTESSSGASFVLVFGVDGAGNPTLQAANVTITNITWAEAEQETLIAPSFTVDADGVITITDTNDADKVGGYKFYLYNESGVLVGSIDVANGMNISELNTSAIAKGTYTAYLTATGSSILYLESEKSTASTTISVTEDPKYDITFATESNALASNSNTWYYWTEYAAVAANYENDTVTITFSNNTGNWYNIQFFYKNSSLTEGTMYTITMNINSTVAGNITINGTVYTLVVGDNAITVPYTETSSSSISIQLGVNGSGIDIEAGTIIIIGIAWAEAEQETLVAPEFMVENGVITITDSNEAEKVGSYKLYLYNESGTVVGSVTVANGMNISDLDTSAIAKGTYTAYLRAIGANALYIDSANSTSSTTIEVTEDPAYTIALKGETGDDSAVSNPDIWFYWTEWGQISNNTYANETVTLTYSNNTGAWYAVQIFYKNSSLTAGTYYKLTMNINSDVAGSITVNGTVVELIAGNNTVEVYYYEGSGASVSIQLGVNATGSTIEAGTIVITNVAWSESEAPSGGDVDDEGYTSLSFTGEENATSGWYYWNDQNWCGSTVTVSEAKYIENEDGTYTVVYSISAIEGSSCTFGFQLFYNDTTNYTVGSTYILTATIVSDADATVTFNGTSYTLTAGVAQNISVEFTYTFDNTGNNLSLFDFQHAISGAISANVTISNIKWTASTSGGETGGETGGDEEGETYDAADFTVLVDTLDTESTYDITHAEEKNDDATVVTAVSNPGTVYVWYLGDYAYWYDWAAVENTDVTANYANGTITWSTTKNATYGSTYHYANQLFYKNSALTSGTTYMLTLTINSSVATSITINGTVVTLTAGENSVTVFYTEGSGASISIQLGVDGTSSDVDEISLTMSNINWYAQEATSGDSGDSGESGDTGSGTESGVTLDATYVNLYGATWLEVQVVTEIDLTSSAYMVYYNGSEAIGKNIYYFGDSSNNTINIQVQISTDTLTEVPSTNVITFKDADGNVVATVTYTPATSGDESGDTGSGDSGDTGDTGSGTETGVTLEATLVQSLYGQTWFEIQVVTEIDLTSSAYTVYYNGSEAIGKNIYYFGDSSNNTINIQIQISTEVVTEIPATNVITFVDADGNTVATVTYTPAA